MRKLIIFILFLTPVIGFTQPERGFNWVFGDSTGLSFSTGNAIPFTTEPCTMAENAASISDVGGNLLFSIGKPNPLVNGYYCSIYNSNYQIIENGDTIINSEDQNAAAIFLPYPGHSNLYCLTYINSHDEIDTNFPVGLYYSIIDASANSGAGKCMLSNIPLIDSIYFSEHIAAVRHANGRDWWILTYERVVDSAITFLLDTSGIHGPYYQSIQIGVQQMSGAFGQMVFSQDGSKLGLAEWTELDIFDFDRCTGLLSNPNYYNLDDFSMPSSNFLAACAFSPDGHYFYAGGGTNNYSDSLYQLNISSGQMQRIYGDANGDTTPVFDMAQLQLAPNGKIYFSSTSANQGYGVSTYGLKNTHLSIINNPDAAGLSCNFTPYSLALSGGRRCFAGLPNMPNYGLYQLPGSPCDTLGIGVQDHVTVVFDLHVYPNPASDNIDLMTERYIKNGTVAIIDCIGREVLKTEMKNTNNVALDISKLCSGVYFIELKTSDGVGMKKFVKE